MNYTKTNKLITISGFVAISYFEFGKNFSHSPEKHSYWEMVYIDKGNILSVTENEGLPMHQGEVVFHKPNETHAHISNGLDANNMLVVAFSAEGKLLDRLKGKTFTLNKALRSVLSLFIKEAKNALGAIPSKYDNEISLDFSKESFGASHLMECYFTEFLISLIRGEKEVPRVLTKKDHSIADAITSYMNENVCEKLTLKDLCEHFLMGKSKLSGVFFEQTGTSPMKYFSHIKIEKAKVLLRETELSISEISEMLGFSELYIFSRAFKNSTGFSPAEYKKSIF